MTLPTDAQIATIRTYIGTGEPPSDEDLYELLLDTESEHQVAQTILQTRLADLLNSPASFSVPGYSENNTANINALKTSITELQVITATGADGFSVVDLVRADRSGR